jgi:hypothetical protein
MARRLSATEVLSRMVLLANNSVDKINQAFIVLNHVVGMCSNDHMETMIKQVMKETDQLLAMTNNVSELKYGRNHANHPYWETSDEKKTLEYCADMREKLSNMLSELRTQKN